MTRRAFHLDVTTPATIFGIDPVKTLTGVDIPAGLKVLAVKPVTRNPNGQDVWSIALPSDEPLVFSLRTYGALGLGCYDGDLVVFVPPTLVQIWEEKVILAHRGEGEHVTLPQGRALAYTMNLPPGTGTALSLGPAGAIGIRVPPTGGYK